MSGLADLKQALVERKQHHLYRQRRVMNSAQGAEVVVDKKSYLNFCSNDYLGLANHPDVVAAFKHAVDDFGVGSGASHLVCGHSTLHHQLEEELADFVGRDRALVFSSGYMANLGVINALVGKNDYVFEDKLNHASLLDAGLLSGARFQRFLHNDIDNLEARLKKTGEGRKLIVVDSVFSMDGDIAPLSELVLLAEKYNACLMADDAHGIGVLGANGAGCVEHFKLNQKQLPILMGTLGKSFGSFGAFVAGSDDLIETLIQFARSYIYTTALPPAVAAATLASLQVVRSDSDRREHLHHLIVRFKRGAKELGLELMPSDTAIQPLLIGGSEKALTVSEALAEKGFLISAIRPPTVPVNFSRLRITLSASHSVQQVEKLLEALAVVLHEVKE
ncbi:MAG: 8-amino-7-oxononanoate synthase [Pseudomonadales bacterium]